MKGRGLRLRLFVLFALIVFGVASGVHAWNAFARSDATAEFTDEKAAMALLNGPAPQSDNEWDDWYQAYWKATTDKWPLKHEGEGWSALALCFLGAAAIGLVRTAFGADILATPKAPGTVRIVLTLAFVLQIPFIAWYYTRRVDVEHCCGWFSDTTAIPIGEMSIMVLILMCVVALYLLPLIHGGRLPATLPTHRFRIDRKLVLWTVYLVPPVVLFVLMILGGLEELASFVVLGFVGLWTCSIALISAIGASRPSQAIQSLA